MENKNLILFNKLKINLLYAGAAFFFVGIFWLLIAGTGLIGLIILGLGLGLLAYILAGNFRETLEYIKAMDWKAIGSKYYYLLVILAIFIMVNVISNKRFLRWDITESRRYTLSPHTRNLLKQLEQGKKQIKVLFFRTEVPLIESVDDLLKEYKARCPIIEFEYIDPDKAPQRAKEYNIRSINVPYGNYKLYGTIIILSAGLKESIDVVKVDYRQAGGNYQPYLKLLDNLEKDISSAFLRITKSKKKIYFIYGHGEVDLDDMDKSGWSETKKVIADENYIVDKIYLASLGNIPEDCSLLVVGAPQKNYTDMEYEFLNKYLESGGHILVMLEPFTKNNINLFLNKWGLTTSERFVIDPASSYWFQPVIPLIKAYNFHPITEKLQASTYFPTAAGIEIMSKRPEGVDIQPLAKTTPESWLETDTSGKQVKYNPGLDKKGPIDIMVVVSKKIAENKEMRMVIIGDSDFASNSNVKYYGNMDLLLNTLNWLAGKEELIGIRSKPVESREIQLTQVKLKFVLYSCVIILPLLIIVAGVIIWLKRR
ncbi:MAG: GldG family protein [bacterium]|nr:GldG family protein [bacterium]